MFASRTSSSNTSSHIASWQVLSFHSGAFEDSDLLTCDTASLNKCFVFIFRTYCSSSVSHPEHQTPSSQYMCTMTVLPALLSDYTSETTNLQSWLFKSHSTSLYCGTAVNTVSKFWMFTYCLQRQGSPQSAVMNPSMPASVYCTVVLPPAPNHECILGYSKFKTPPSWIASKLKPQNTEGLNICAVNTAKPSI